MDVFVFNMQIRELCAQRIYQCQDVVAVPQL
jgi:hypothetical protein